MSPRLYKLSLFPREGGHSSWGTSLLCFPLCQAKIKAIFLIAPKLCRHISFHHWCTESQDFWHQAQHLSTWEQNLCLPLLSEPHYLIVAVSEGAVPDDLTFPRSPSFTVWVWVTWEGLSYCVWTFLTCFPAISKFQCSSSYWWVSRCEIILKIAIVISTKTTHFALYRSEREL